MIVLGLLLCLAGLGVATYLTIEHFNTSLSLACPDTGRINCQKVTSSQYSHVLGIPVAVLGLFYFVVALPLFSPWAWWSGSPLVRLARLGWVGVGLAMVLYLVWAEFFGVSAICLWCTSVHVITFLLFCLVAFTEAWTAPLEPA
ncbi:MAG: vitamin K epoxide reductase family protein [Nocardioides sp.]